MSSPPSKNVSETNGNKPKKSGKTNSNAKSGSMDTRAELADLIKKKAETSVRHNINKPETKGTYHDYIVWTDRNNWPIWSDRSTHSRGPIWRTPSCAGISSAAGSATWPPTRPPIPRPTSGIASSRRQNASSPSPALPPWLYVIVSGRYIENCQDPGAYQCSDSAISWDIGIHVLHRIHYLSRYTNVAFSMKT